MLNYALKFIGNALISAAVNNENIQKKTAELIKKPFKGSKQNGEIIKLEKEIKMLNFRLNELEFHNGFNSGNGQPNVSSEVYDKETGEILESMPSDNQQNNRL